MTHPILGCILLLAFSSVPLQLSAQSSQAPAGKATVSLVGDGVNVTGQYPTQLCGGPYMLGEGMSYQVRAGDWQITVASEKRETGDVDLNDGDGNVQVVATASGGGRHFVRKPADKGSLKVAEDFKRAEATLDLRSPVGPEKAKLVVTFDCR